MSTLEFKEVHSEEQFDPLTIDSQAPFTQSYFYGEWQKALGRNVRRFRITSGSAVVCFLQLVAYPLIRGKKYLYAPYGPVIKEFTPELMETLRNHLRKIAEEEQAVFVRLDFSPPPQDRDRALLRNFLTKAPRYTYHAAFFQPRTEWVLDLASDEGLLKAMDSKTRYGIRTAEKRGVAVEVVPNNIGAHFNAFYSLMEETAARNKFGLHPQKYYKEIFADSEKRGNAYLVLARYNSKILVVDFIVTFGRMAHYVFSGSSNDHRHLMPSYLAQWEAIRRARDLACTVYNFGGISTGVSRPEWKGITLFKTRFGGRAAEHSPFYDLVVHPLWYHVYGIRKLLQKIF